MEQKKPVSMRTLSIALTAASALILTVIIIALGGAAKRSENPQESTLESTAEQTEEITTESVTTEAVTATATEEITTEEETTEAPRHDLAFTSNGDGTCYVSGIGSYQRNDVEIPTLSPTGDIVTGIGGYAFYNNSEIARISIPSTVRTVGEYAFLGCSALCEVTVSKNNTAFKTADGILYSRDGTQLILCPPMRGKTSCTIETAVTVIACGAFAGVKNLREVHYTGTPEGWIRIIVHAHNDLLDGIRLVCNYKAE